MSEAKKDTEAQWSEDMVLAQQGNKEAYSRLLNSVMGPLRSYFRRRVFDPGAIEDLVQETLLSVHKARHTYLPQHPFAPWLFSIAKYRMIDFLRKSGRSTSKEQSLETLDCEHLIPEIDPTREASRNFNEELSEGLTEALAAIPDRQRQAVLLLKQDDKSVKEAAQAMGISESALKVLAHRGYTALRNFIQNSKNK